MNNTHNHAIDAFKAGISVLAPSLSPKPFMLLNDPHGLRDLLAISFEGSYFYFDKNGYFVRSDSTETDDFQPSLFHNTPANRQAIATLLAVDVTTPAQKLIDTTSSDDKEVITLSACDLSDIACDINGTITVLNDLSQLLGLIRYDKADDFTIKALARLSQDAILTWLNILDDRLNTINEPLALTVFGKEGE